MMLAHGAGSRAVVLRNALAAFAVLVLGCGASEPEAPTAEVSLEFVALWWSEGQMEGLDPDDPPQKQTEVRLERWEYTDPIGVPNPETFEVVARLRVSPKLGKVSVRAEQRWAIGPFDDEERARWGEWEPLASEPVVPPPPDGELEVRLASVDLEARQEHLFELERWPWAYEARVELSGEDGTLATAERRLEIRPGD